MNTFVVSDWFFCCSLLRKLALSYNYFATTASFFADAVQLEKAGKYLSFQLLSCLFAASSASGYYGYGGPGIARHPYGGTSYVGRTVWGFPGGYRHKREAEADAEPGYGYGGYGGYGYGGYGYGGGVAAHPYGGSSYVGRTVWGIGKRSAPAPAPAPEKEEKAYAKHPKGGLSFVGRTVWGFPSAPKHKREAEPSYGSYGGYGYGAGVAAHPYGGSSYVGRTVWGFPGGYRHKREAEPSYGYGGYGGYGYGGGVAAHPYGGSSYVGRTVWGFPGGYRG